MKPRLSVRKREKQTEALAVNVAELLAALESTNAELVVRRRREKVLFGAMAALGLALATALGVLL